jgi:HSP20 family protein
MDLHKLNPWNWFKHEESGNKTLPVKRENEALERSPDGLQLSQLHREIDRLFENAFRSFGLPIHSRSEFMSPFFSNEFASAFRADVNIASNDNQYVITLEAPGLAQDDLSIELQDRILVIRGVKEQEQEEKDQHYYRKERRFGSFQRVLAVPDDADVDNIHAAMDKGVLSINIPRKAVDQSNVKKISINKS